MKYVYLVSCPYQSFRSNSEFYNALLSLYKTGNIINHVYLGTSATVDCHFQNG